MILDKNSPINLMLQKTLNSKRFSLQFLPECLLSVSKEKKIVFKGNNLKSAYLIDIIHNLILKYYFKRENMFNINALVLKDKYGHLYNYYIQYLTENGFLTLQKNHRKGSNSRVYSLNTDIITGKIHRFKNVDRILIKKYINRYYQFEMDRNDLIPRDVKDKLILDLYSVKIQYDKSIFYLDSLKKEDMDIYNRNVYSVESINENHMFYHFDHYGRLHTNFTILKAFIRKNCLLIDDEETCEIDIPNSQPLFLSKLIKDSDSKWVDKDELDLFSILVKNGNYYQYLVDNLKLKNRGDAKEMTYKVFFGKNRESKWDRYFRTLFPTIHRFIVLYKKEHEDYRVLAYQLQRMESNLIFNQTVRTLMIINPDIKIITVHDSIVVQRKYKDIVSSVFNSKLAENFNI